MKLYVGFTILAAMACTSDAFAPHMSPVRQSRNVALSMSNEGEENPMAFLRCMANTGKNVIAATAMAAAVWTSPASLTSIAPTISSGDNAPLSIVSDIGTANAVEKASGTGSRVNKDAESLLRYGLPINNKEVRKLQVVIEEIKQDIGSKRKSAALDGVKKARTAIKSTASKMTASCRDANFCTTILNEMNDNLDPLDQSLKDSQGAQNGSEQERKALDAAYQSQSKIAKQLTALEENMVPANYVTPVPSDYDDLPQLKGRATVEFELVKPDGAPFDIEGTNFPKANMVMVIDGYTSPVTGGNFVDLVQKGFYTNMKISRSDGFVVQSGEPSEGPAIGYVGKPSKSVGAGKNGERLIPCEISIRGDKGPIYETTIEDEGRGGEATVLPFSSYGAMGWARDEYEVNSGSSQFFWLLFDSDLTPAGKNVLDGRYPCFGYVVEGADFLSDVKEGDIIKSAKVTKGLELLQQPK